MSKLPSEAPPRFRNDPSVISAYNICLNLERGIQKEIDATRDVGRSMIYCRILGYLIHYAPSDEASKAVVQEIISCNEERVSLLEVGEMYYNHYIGAFRFNKGKISTPSNDSSRPSFDTLADMAKHLLEKAPQNHSGAKNKALVRDDFRCAITGSIDVTCALENRELKQKVTREKLRIGHTRCAHIISESINACIPQGSEKAQYAATVWTIHRLDNVITMGLDVHQDFDNLHLWLIQTDQVNQYKLEAIDPILLNDLPQLVTFTTHDQTNLPVPNPAYLALHASCAKVGHLSGAAEYIEKMFSDMEETRVLSADG
ncbi:hypothetical protein M422DRAFT_164180, partial [Sphaerobolus stellatus SS14]